ncbi:MAG TPA: DUF1345 domain-containing protein [Acidimicrobiales bacterium]|jgi:uncharacterized membrane protein|nr:DUF1345 domain-containing protein [Acidimicrobiales bacterium]
MIRPRRGPTGTRVLVATLAGVIFGVGLGYEVPWEAADLVGWDVASVIFLVWTWAVIGPKSSSDTREHADLEDASAPLADLVVTTAAIACIVGAGFALLSASSATGGEKAGLISLAVASVLFSWAAIHTVFTLRYARLYYRTPAGGINFNDDDPPAYLDFAYFALTVGMTFQVSDTNIEQKSIRYTALRHALISWLFGAVLIGLTINVLASLLSGGGVTK